MLTLARLLALSLVAWIPLQDPPPEKKDPAQDEPQICTKSIGCHTEHDAEKIDCPDCKKTKIPKNDALCSSCATKAKRCPHCGLPKTAGGGTIKDAFKVIAPADMQKVITKIASDEFQGRQTGSEGIKKARAYIIEQLKTWGVKPAGDSYELPWGSCCNIGAIYPGSDPKLKDEIVVVGSHYDHIGIGGASG